MEPLLVHKVIRDGRIFNLRNWREGAVNVDDLLEAVVSLFAILHERQINYTLVGGIAMLQYVEGRNTEDIDLIIAVSDLQKLPEVKITGRETHFARGQLDSLQIDFLLADHPLFERVRCNHTTRQPFLEYEIPTATVEGLLLLKLYALPSLYRQGNFARVGLTENDIATLIYQYEPDVSSILDALSSYLGDSDMASLREIVDEIGERIARFHEQAGEDTGE